MRLFKKIFLALLGIPLLRTIIVLYFVSTPAAAANGDNIALVTQGGTATQSSYYSGAWPASNCIDGVTSSNNNADLCHSGWPRATNHWWDLKLADSKSIDRIVVHNRTNCCSIRILNMYVLVSDSPFPPGTDASSLAAARAQAIFEYQITVDTTITTISVGDLPGQYVRLQKADGTSNYNLLEIQVFEGREEIDLDITKSASDSTPNIGDVITFTLTITNAGLHDASNFLVKDKLPAGLSNVTNISHSGTVDSFNTINWTIPVLSVGTTISLNYETAVLPP